MIIKIHNIDWLILDADYICHRAYYAYTNPLSPQTMLKTTTGILSGVFFGFFSLLLRKIQEYNPKNIVVAWGDRREHLHRKLLSPQYKEGRSVMPEEFYSQLDDIKLALIDLGVAKQYIALGYEADDIIATIVHRVAGDNNKEGVYIATRDKDMFQLVNDKNKVKVINLGVKAKVRDEEFDEAKVIEKFGIRPCLFADYLSLVGDTADGIVGIKGIGPKTAVKILLDNGPIREWFSDIFSIESSSKVKQLIYDNRQQLVLNKKLVSLHKVNVHLNPLEEDVNLKDLGVSSQDIFDKYQMHKIKPQDFLSN